MKRGGGGEGEGGCEGAGGEVEGDLCSPSAWAGGRLAGCGGSLTAPAEKQRGFICFLSFLLPPLGARRGRKDKKLNRCQEGAAATRKWHSAPH